jgi:hypothetical protein
MYDRKQERDLAYQKKKELQEIKKMKKTIVAILVIAIAAFSCFAVADVTDEANLGQQINLKGTISEVAVYNYELMAGTTSGIYEGSPSEVTVDITGAGSQDFSIIDSTAYRMLTDTTRTLEVTVGNFINQFNGDYELSTNFSASAAGSEVKSADEKTQVTYTATASGAAVQSLTFTATYKQYENIVLGAANVLGTFTVSWPTLTTLAAGNYISEVKLAVTAI